MSNIDFIEYEYNNSLIDDIFNRCETIDKLEETLRCNNIGFNLVEYEEYNNYYSYCYNIEGSFLYEAIVDKNNLLIMDIIKH